MKRRAPRKARRAPKKGMRRAGKRGMKRNPNPNFAVSTETISVGEVNCNIAIQRDLTIQACPRALAVAKCFKYYRLKTVEYIYTPVYNTYQEGVSAVSKPYFYYVMNRTGSTTNQSFTALEAQGAVPIAFTKPIKIKYAPNLVQELQVIQQGGNPVVGTNSIGNTPVYSKWIGTEAFFKTATENLAARSVQETFNCPVYNGHVDYVRQDLTDEAPLCGTLSIHVTWEFKEPQVQTTETAKPAA